MKKNASDQETKERLLDTAEALFAEKGYKAVTVREITAAAGCNLGAVNYHFSNKKNLYLEVFRQRWLARAKKMREFFTQLVEESGEDPPSPRTVVKSLARAFLSGPWTDEERRRHHQLISREMARPTEAFEVVAQQAHRPFMKLFLGLLAPNNPPGYDQESMMLDMLCIFGMVLHFNLARPMISHLFKNDEDDQLMEHIANHIAGFAGSGMFSAPVSEE